MAAPVKPDPSASTDAEGGEQEGGLRLSPLEAAIAEARRASTEGEPLVPPAKEEGEGDEKPAGEAEAEGAEASEAEGGEPDATEEDEEGAADADAGAEETEAGEEGGEPPETEGAAEADAQAEDDVDPELVVGLPPRREGDEEVEIVAENQEVAERLRQLKNQAVAGAQLQEREAKVETDFAQIEEMELQIGTDPVGFILKNVPEQTIGLLTLALVTDDAVLASIKDQLFPALQDEKELRTLRAELKGARAEAKNSLRDAVEAKRYGKEQAKIIRGAIAHMVPVTDGISESRRTAIIQDLELAAATEVRTKQLQKVEPGDLPVLLSAKLRAHGIDPLAASKAITDGANSEAGSTSSPKKKAKRPTTKELKTASARRKKAAAVTPPGGSAPASRPKLPEGQKLSDRFKLAREKGLGALLSNR